MADVVPPESQMSAGDRTGGQPLAPGTRVEVRNNFDGRWARGFEIIAADPDGYRIRRLSDGGELPLRFVDGDLRHEKEKRRAGTWWY